MSTKQSMSYEELCCTDFTEIERLFEANLLDDETRERCAHLFRFLERIESTAGDILVEDDLQRIWRETAGEAANRGSHPQTLH